MMPSRQDYFVTNRDGVPHEPAAVLRLNRRNWPKEKVANLFGVPSFLVRPMMEKALEDERTHVLAV